MMIMRSCLEVDDMCEVALYRLDCIFHLLNMVLCASLAIFHQVTLL
jgi:hypothetical protein